MSDPSGVDALVRLLPALTLIVGGLLAVRWWARRSRVGAHGGVRVLARTPVTRGSVVAVVAVGDRRFLVGGSDSSVSLLSELDPDADQGGDTAALTAAPTPTGPRNGPTLSRPWNGLVDRLRTVTVRTSVERPPHVPEPR